MKPTTRRSFLRTSATLTAAWPVVRRARAQTAPNDRVRVALIGCGGRGRFVVRVMVDECGAECVSLCDLSEERLRQAWEFLSPVQPTQPRLETDHNRVLAAGDVDAVIVATPDIWHAPLTIAACQAGKDVYVEKPHSHNIWESGQMVKAARKYNRIVQVGTQNRSKEYNLAAREVVRSGRLGKIAWSKSST